MHACIMMTIEVNGCQALRLALHRGYTDLDTEYIATYGYISKCISTYDTLTYTPASVHTIYA